MDKETDYEYYNRDIIEKAHADNARLKAELEKSQVFQTIFLITCIAEFLYIAWSSL
jgi:hypothetical protein